MKIKLNYILYFGFNKKTPLHLAVEKGNSEIIKLIMECNDIDVNAKDEISN